MHSLLQDREVCGILAALRVAKERTRAGLEKALSASDLTPDARAMMLELHEDIFEQDQQRHEARIERQSIEELFSLGGGELEDKPWEPWAPHPVAIDLSKPWYEWSDAKSERQSFRYHYDGAPEYAHPKDRHDSGVEYCTVVCDRLFGGPPEVLIDGGRTWKWHETFQSSGETECVFGPGKAGECEGFEDAVAARPCDYCEAQEGEEHGYIYLDEGWCEVVYRHTDPVCEGCKDPIHQAKDGTRFCSDECAEEYLEDCVAREVHP